MICREIFYINVYYPYQYIVLVNVCAYMYKTVYEYVYLSVRVYEIFNTYVYLRVWKSKLGMLYYYFRFVL